MPTMIPYCRRHTRLGTKCLLFNVNHTYQDMYALNFTFPLRSPPPITSEPLSHSELGEKKDALLW